MPRLINYVAIINELPPRRLWPQAIMMSIPSHLWMIFGPPQFNILVTIGICILMNFIELNAAMERRDRVYSDWLIKHFKRLREEQYRMAESSKEARLNIVQLVKSCKEMELQSLLSYPHEHTKTCAKNCLLRHGDIFVVFGEDRDGALPPRFERQKPSAKAIDVSKLADDLNHGTDANQKCIEEEGGAEKTMDQKDMGKGGNSSPEKGQKTRKIPYAGSDGKIAERKVSETDAEKLPETIRKTNVTYPKKNEGGKPNQGTINGEPKLELLLDQMWKEEFEEEQRLKAAKAEEHNKKSSAVEKMEREQDAPRPQELDEDQEISNCGVPVGSEHQELPRGKLEDEPTLCSPGSAKNPESSKAKGPKAQRKKDKKKR